MTESFAQGSERQVWGVSALLQAVSDALFARFGASVVRGEVSGFSRAASGHCYFNLKDADRGEGTLRCAMFRRAATLLDFAPADGQRVDVRGRLGIYGPRGELQLVVESMQRTGAGALYEQFIRLRAALEREGLFDPSLKRPLPAFPRRLGIVTSLGAAALHDVLTALARRAPHVEAIVYPSAVQGADAPAALCEAIARAGRRLEVDALIVCRGGGALEDLWAFNDERVVRAIRASPMPVVCGVGHETDVTLSDLAADVRAPTPTAAAELAAPEQSACLAALGTRQGRLQRGVQDALDTRAQRLERAARRLARPGEVLRRQSHGLELLAHRLMAASRSSFESGARRADQVEARLRRDVGVVLARHEARLVAVSGRLGALDPTRVLARGYALLTDLESHAVTSVGQVSRGAALVAHLVDGRVAVSVESVDRTSPPRHE